MLGGIAATSQQQGKASRAPLLGQAGQPCRYAEAYARTGVSHVFLSFAPLAGGRHVQVTDRRTTVDCAPCLHALVEMPLPHAPKLVLRLANFTTPHPAALDAAVSPPDARRSMEKIAGHPTPQHGRWLPMAESALRVRQRHWVDRRIPEQER